MYPARVALGPEPPARGLMAPGLPGCLSASGGHVGTTLTVAAVLAITALAASMFSVELGLSVAVIEILAGIVVGNTLHLATPDWLVFFASFGSVVLTFLAGAEVDPAALRKSWKASVLIGTLSFLAPFVLALLACRYVAGGTGGRRRSVGSPCPPPPSPWCTRCWWRPACPPPASAS